MEKKEKEAAFIKKSLETQIEALFSIKATMPVIMESRFYDDKGLLHQNYLKALHELQMSVMILQGLTNEGCEQVLAMHRETNTD